MVWNSETAWSEIGRRNLHVYQRSIRSQTVLTARSTGFKGFSMTWGRKPIFNPLSTTNFIRLCHFTRVRLWTVYNPNRSMLGLMLANALDLVYTCLDQIFNGRIFHRCNSFTRNCANSVPDCSILCRSKAGPARVIERWIFSSFCPFKDLPGPVYMRSWKELYMERKKNIFCNVSPDYTHTKC